jgi:hypothetical protein
MVTSDCVAAGRCTPLSQGLDYDDYNVLHPDNNGVYYTIFAQAGEVSHLLTVF